MSNLSVLVGGHLFSLKTILVLTRDPLICTMNHPRFILPKVRSALCAAS